MCLTFYYKSVIHMARVDRRNLPENGTPENVSSAFGGAFILPILQGKGSKSTHCPTPDNEKKSRRDADPLQCPNDMLYFSLLESGGKFRPLWILWAVGLFFYSLVGLYSSFPVSMKSKKSLIFFSLHPAALSPSINLATSVICISSMCVSFLRLPGYYHSVTTSWQLLLYIIKLCLSMHY